MVTRTRLNVTLYVHCLSRLKFLKLLYVLSNMFYKIYNKNNNET